MEYTSRTGSIEAISGRRGGGRFKPSRDDMFMDVVWGGWMVAANEGELGGDGDLSRRE